MHFGKARLTEIIEYRGENLGGGQGNQLGSNCNDPDKK